MLAQLVIPPCRLRCWRLSPGFMRPLTCCSPPSPPPPGAAAPGGAARSGMHAACAAGGTARAPAMTTTASPCPSTGHGGSCSPRPSARAARPPGRPSPAAQRPQLPVEVKQGGRDWRRLVSSARCTTTRSPVHPCEPWPTPSPVLSGRLLLNSRAVNKGSPWAPQQPSLSHPVYHSLGLSTGSTCSGSTHFASWRCSRMRAFSNPGTAAFAGEGICTGSGVA